MRIFAETGFLGYGSQLIRLTGMGAGRRGRVQVTELPNNSPFVLLTSFPKVEHFNLHATKIKMIYF